MKKNTNRGSGKPSEWSEGEEDKWRVVCVNWVAATCKTTGLKNAGLYQLSLVPDLFWHR
jgi:hypothetical protein